MTYDYTPLIGAAILLGAIVVFLSVHLHLNRKK
jgi:hypothetical protein